MRLKMNEGGENFEFLREGERERERDRERGRENKLSQSIGV